MFTALPFVTRGSRTAIRELPVATFGAQRVILELRRVILAVRFVIRSL